MAAQAVKPHSSNFTCTGSSSSSSTTPAEPGDYCYLLHLPPELLLKVFSFLPAYDKMCVRVTCRQLYSFIADAALWKSVSWDYTSRRYRQALVSTLKVCASSVTSLQVQASISLTTRVAFTRLLSSQIAKCQYVQTLCLTGFNAKLGDFQSIVSSLRFLEHVEFETVIVTKESLRDCLQAAKSLKSLKLWEPSPGDLLCLCHFLIEVWPVVGYNPPEIGLVCCYGDSSRDISSEIKWFFNRVSSFPPSDHEACLRVFSKGMPAAVGLPRLPLFEVHVGSTVSIPLAECELLGLPSGYLLALSRVTPGSEHYSSAYYVKCSSLRSNATSFTSFSSHISVLNLSWSVCLESSHLEALADFCPTLTWLSIEGCSKALVALAGLTHVASKCSMLKGLNMKGIHRSEVESILQLWVVLSTITRLEYVGIAPCLIQPEAGEPSLIEPPALKRIRMPYVPAPNQDSIMQMQEALSKMKRLVALEIEGPSRTHPPTFECCNRNFAGAELDLLSNLAGLQYLRLARLPPVSLTSGFTSLLRNLQQLKYLLISKYSPGKLTLPTDPQCYASLQQFCINDDSCSVHDAVIEALVCNRRLTHLFLNIGSISKGSIRRIESNFPRLVGFHLYVDRAVVQGAGRPVSVTELEHHTRQRKIDNFGFKFPQSRFSRSIIEKKLSPAILSSDMRAF